DPAVTALLAQAYGKIGRADKTRQMLTQLKEESTRRYVSAYSFAVIYSVLGEKERAIDCLEQGYREHATFDLMYIKVDALRDPLRSEPRFTKLVEEMFPERK